MTEGIITSEITVASPRYAESGSVASRFLCFPRSPAFRPKYTLRPNSADSCNAKAKSMPATLAFKAGPGFDARKALRRRGSPLGRWMPASNGSRDAHQDLRVGVAISAMLSEKRSEKQTRHPQGNAVRECQICFVFRPYPSPSTELFYHKEVVIFEFEQSNRIRRTLVLSCTGTDSGGTK